MDFRQFSKQRKSENAKKEEKNGGVTEDELKKTFDETVKRSKNMTQQQLMDEILRQAAEDRRSGKLSDGDLQNFYNSVSPMLSAEQLKKLKDIMALLKNE